MELNGFFVSLSQIVLEMVKYSDSELGCHQKQVPFVKTDRLSVLTGQLEVNKTVATAFESTGGED